jgi:hypothetical protein
MSEGSFVATSAGVSPESFPHSAIANAEPWPRPGICSSLWRSTCLLEVRTQIVREGQNREVYSGAPQMLIL